MVIKRKQVNIPVFPKEDIFQPQSYSSQPRRWWRHSYRDTSPNDLLIIQAGTKSAWLHQTTGRGRSNKGTVCLYPAFTRPHVEHSVPFWDSQQGDNNGEPQWWWGDWRGLILAWRREVWEENTEGLQKIIETDFSEVPRERVRDNN